MTVIRNQKSSRLDIVLNSDIIYLLKKIFRRLLYAQGTDLQSSIFSAAFLGQLKKL